MNGSMHLGALFRAAAVAAAASQTDFREETAAMACRVGGNVTSALKTMR
ncbi:hypothetical protein [Paenibacillus sp. HB172176]|nr:hypothetical protein [Paenibacillus sp. HB172176]